MSASQKTQHVDLEAGAGSGGGAASGGGAPPDVKEIVENKSEEKRVSNVSECSVVVVDPGAETKVCLSKTERDCRICHMGLDAGSQETGLAIELGCSCKDDLAAAHKQCAEAWFKIKGNRTCEICGAIAQNVSGVPEADLTEQWNGANDATTATSSAPLSEPRNFWQGHRFLNFLLACVVFAFVLSWLFHFNVPS